MHVFKYQTSLLLLKCITCSFLGERLQPCNGASRQALHKMALPGINPEAGLNILDKRMKFETNLNKKYFLPLEPKSHKPQMMNEEKEQEHSVINFQDEFQGIFKFIY